MQTWTDHLISFYRDLQPPSRLPKGISWLYPQQFVAVQQILRQFLDRFYTDTAPRKIWLGINPGRFGAGVTGVNFTAPRQLRDFCRIEHDLGNGTELSAEFIYAMISGYGGPEPFYAQCFIGSVCPLGFVKDGRNINYYDDKNLLAAVEPFIVRNLNRLLQGRPIHDTCVCIGGEKNFKYLMKLNDRHQWFKQIVALPHPRFIMQYRRREVPQFIQQYLQLITK